MDLMLDGYTSRKTLTLEDYGSTLGEGLSAFAEQLGVENPVSVLSRLNDLNNAGIEYQRNPDFPPTFEEGWIPIEKNLLSKDAAAARAKEHGVEIEIPDRGITQGKLDILIQRKRDEIKRKAIIDSMPSGIIPGAAKIATALLVSMADPLNIASAFVPVVGEANMARLTGILGKTGGRLAAGAIEGSVGAAMIEPIVYTGMTAEQADYSLYDSYLNVTIGGVLGGGLHAGMGAIGDAIAKASARTKVDLLHVATAQALENKAIDVTRVADSAGVSRTITTQEARAAEIAKIKEEIQGTADKKLSRGEEKELTRELKDLEYKKGKLEEEYATLRESGTDTTKIRDEITALDQQIDPIRTRLDENQIAKEAFGDISRLNQGVIPKRFQDRINAVENATAKDLHDPTAPTHSRTSDPEASKLAAERLASKAQDTPEAITQETNDMMAAMKENGVDVKELSEKMADIEKQVERNANGIRAAVACMLGRV